MAIKTIVYIDADTKRILGFSPEGIKPLFPPGTRYDEKTPFDTLEMENWLKKYREQAHFDAEEKASRKVMREKPIRDAIKAAIRARNNVVNSLNRDLNNALIAFMDAEYDRIVRMQANPETFGIAEAYEESKLGEDLALEAPVFRKVDKK
jgi:hypothetical protein